MTWCYVLIIHPDGSLLYKLMGTMLNLIYGLNSWLVLRAASILRLRVHSRSASPLCLSTVFSQASSRPIEQNPDEPYPHRTGTRV